MWYKTNKTEKAFQSIQTIDSASDLWEITVYTTLSKQLLKGKLVKYEAFE